MNPSERDYRQVARWLDGAAVELTPAQRALAEQIQADAARVGPALDVQVPGGVLHRVRARMGGAGEGSRRLLPRPGALVRRPGLRRLGRVGWAAAAAAVLIAAGLLWLGDARRPGANGVSALQYLQSFLRPQDDLLDPGAELLGEQIADHRMELSLDDAWPFEMAVQGLAEEIDQFGLEEMEPVGEDWPDSSRWSVP